MGSEKFIGLRTAAVIGGGPSGLMAAEVLVRSGVKVDLYESMPSVGRKFLIAGKGGLNLTHVEPQEKFLSRYGLRCKQIESMINIFGPKQLRMWVHDLGIETFVGSSGKVFPVCMKSFPILQAWLKRLKNSGVVFHLRYKWRGWTQNGSICFETPEGPLCMNPDVVVLALGGGSRARLGSSGAWIPLLIERGISVAVLKPANCGFDVAWSDHFRTRYAGSPLKSIVLTFNNFQGITFHKQGEFLITGTGVEGNLIYMISSQLRDEIEESGRAIIRIDLAPGWSYQRLIERLSLPRGSRTLSGHLEKTVHIKGLKVGLLREFVSREHFKDPIFMAKAIKELSIPLIATRPLDEAISSAGGVLFEELDSQLMIRSIPGVFCAGEMLDWEAPTGGYLLTACFASGYVAGLGATAWLENLRK
jgi:uncharacterized flavoprotein (TIGR03862 family)